MVEHDQLYAKMIIPVLEKENLAVTHYSSMADLYRDTSNTDYDVVIVDNNLGLVNADRLCNYLKRQKAVPYMGV